MKRWLTVLLVISGFVFSGCGSDGSTPDNFEEVVTTSPLGSVDNPIITDEDVREMYETLDDINKKSDYETQEEYEIRISNYVNSSEILYLELDGRALGEFYFKYDAELRRMYFYDSFVLNSNNQSYYLGFLSNYRIDIHDFDSSPVLVEYVPSLDDEKRIYYSTMKEPADAQEIEEHIYEYRILLGFKLNMIEGITEYFYSSYTGSLYTINGDLKYLKVYNKSTNEVLREYRAMH